MDCRSRKPIWNGLVGLLLFGLLFESSSAWGKSDKVKLKDMEVLTLHTGAVTTGRRSSPVPQLKCVGGTANCAFVPQVVQCYNRGSDGYDVQWECKSDMDNAYRFGRVSVTCEGYDYPDDPYVLTGSCGLEYTIDLTKEGMANAQHSQNHDYYGGGGGGGGAAYGWNPNLYKTSKKSDFITNLACGAVVVVIVYAIYKTCIAPTVEQQQRSTTNDDHDRRGPGTSPPPPGFRSNYYSSSSNDGGFFGGGSDSCDANRQSGSGTGTGAAGRNAGGFWTGAAAGGLLGYMFGQRNNTNNHYGGMGMGTGYRSRPSTSWGSGSSGSSWGGSSGFSSGSSGTRTASGFGGTSRR